MVGFIGLELISIEIGDPFGTHPNSFPVEALSEVVIADISVILRDIDGPLAVLGLQINNNELAPKRRKRTLRKQRSRGPIKNGRHDPLHNVILPVKESLVSVRESITSVRESLISVDKVESTSSEDFRDCVSLEDSHIDSLSERNTNYGTLPKGSIRESELDCTLSVGGESDSDSSFDYDHDDISLDSDSSEALEFTSMKTWSHTHENAAYVEDNLNSEIIKSLHRRLNSDASIDLLGSFRQKASFDNATGILKFEEVNP